MRATCNNAALITEKMITLLKQFQRRAVNSRDCAHQTSTYCFGYQAKKIMALIEARSPIQFVLPAFPAKSPNAEKTYGELPDLGERLALKWLNDMAASIQTFYAPGAVMIVCSDGRVFSDLVRVSEADVDAYAAGIRQIIHEEQLSRIETYSLDDCYANLNYEEMRAHLLNDYGDTLSIVKARVKKQLDATILFNGIHRFIYEDQRVHFPSASNNQVRLLAKETTYQVIQRSNAWSHLVEKKFPNAVRLSIHPQACGAEKLGILLLESADAWATPWHRVVLQEGDHYRLVKRREAEALKARVVFVNNQFSHYVM